MHNPAKGRGLRTDANGEHNVRIRSFVAGMKKNSDDSSDGSNH